MTDNFFSVTTSPWEIPGIPTALQHKVELLKSPIQEMNALTSALTLWYQYLSAGPSSHHHITSSKRKQASRSLYRREIFAHVVVEDGINNPGRHRVMKQASSFNRKLKVVVVFSSGICDSVYTCDHLPLRLRCFSAWPAACLHE